MSLYNQVLNNLSDLKLEQSKLFLGEYLEEASKKQLSYLEVLKELTDRELKHKKLRSAKMRIKVGNFPFEKGLNDFDFDYQSSINKKEIYELSTLSFIELKKNILFLGSPGVGKTHLAVAVGIAAADNKYSVYFIHAHNLISDLVLAHNENRLESRLKHFSKYKLLIIDEIGYLPIDNVGSNLFFQLIARRYEKSSTIVTTNQPFSRWGEVFDNPVVASAILDRLLHHSHVINITGRSYRVKDKFVEIDKNKMQL